MLSSPWGALIMELLLVLVIWHTESRRVLRFIDRQRTLGIEI